MPQQFELHRRVTRRPRVQPRGTPRANPPAAIGGARPRLGNPVQQQDRHPRFFRRHRKPPARGQIKTACPHRFDHHRRQRRTPYRIARRTQQTRLVGCHDLDQPRRIKTEFSQPRTIEPPGRPDAAFLADPQQRSLSHAYRQHQGETCQRAAILGRSGEQLMQSRARQAATQPMVERLHAEHKAPAVAWLRSVERGDLRSQGGKSGTRLIHVLILFLFFFRPPGVKLSRLLA